ncbi:uncharacterized protein CMU_010530 [Cryptosporidium muris RN66]|uniref:RPAP1 C-terminal domain-containing protein n=1 Tax=Cryptosporidium muris (strain RN66) TaxID=441375 RepID=B6AIR4_CRYMR|nr:uncharacterized protein CMU_010530 [Cryptosporidium muris RN66]EEA08105.1 hypothetical protein, conserved [Cryptosporidium muris RN66]|eukprot:XP_002142454.1 hypothetical protein [Cryptosporidium muris RN66]
MQERPNKCSDSFNSCSSKNSIEGGNVNFPKLGFPVAFNRREGGNNRRKCISFKESKAKDIELDVGESLIGNLSELKISHIDLLKLRWTNQIEQEEIDKDENKGIHRIRFGFDGSLCNQSCTNIEDNMKYYNGLYHHSAEPDKAGYSLPEILHLCKSSNSAQRCIALRTLVNILKKSRCILNKNEPNISLSNYLVGFSFGFERWFHYITTDLSVHITLLNLLFLDSELSKTCAYSIIALCYLLSNTYDFEQTDICKNNIHEFNKQRHALHWLQYYPSAIEFIYDMDKNLGKMAFYLPNEALSLGLDYFLNKDGEVFWYNNLLREDHIQKYILPNGSEITLRRDLFQEIYSYYPHNYESNLHQNAVLMRLNCMIKNNKCVIDARIASLRILTTFIRRLCIIDNTCDLASLIETVITKLSEEFSDYIPMTLPIVKDNLKFQCVDEGFLRLWLEYLLFLRIYIESILAIHKDNKAITDHLELLSRQLGTHIIPLVRVYILYGFYILSISSNDDITRMENSTLVLLGTVESLRILTCLSFHNYYAEDFDIYLQTFVDFLACYSLPYNNKIYLGIPAYMLFQFFSLATCINNNSCIDISNNINNISMNYIGGIISNVFDSLHKNFSSSDKSCLSYIIISLCRFLGSSYTNISNSNNSALNLIKEIFLEGIAKQGILLSYLEKLILQSRRLGSLLIREKEQKTAIDFIPNSIDILILTIESGSLSTTLAGPPSIKGLLSSSSHCLTLDIITASTCVREIMVLSPILEDKIFLKQDKLINFMIELRNYQKSQIGPFYSLNSEIDIGITEISSEILNGTYNYKNYMEIVHSGSTEYPWLKISKNSPFGALISSTLLCLFETLSVNSNDITGIGCSLLLEENIYTIACSMLSCRQVSQFMNTIYILTSLLESSSYKQNLSNREFLFKLLFSCFFKYFGEHQNLCFEPLLLVLSAPLFVPNISKEYIVEIFQITSVILKAFLIGKVNFDFMLRPLFEYLTWSIVYQDDLLGINKYSQILGDYYINITNYIEFNILIGGTSLYRWDVPNNDIITKLIKLIFNFDNCKPIKFEIRSVNSIFNPNSVVDQVYIDRIFNSLCETVYRSHIDFSIFCYILLFFISPFNVGPKVQLSLLNNEYILRLLFSNTEERLLGSICNYIPYIQVLKCEKDKQVQRDLIKKIDELITTYSEIYEPMTESLIFKLLVIQSLVYSIILEPTGDKRMIMIYKSQYLYEQSPDENVRIFLRQIQLEL